MTMQTADDPLDRCRWKMRLLRPLYQRGLTAEEVRKLFRVLDWMMQLPEDIELEFQLQLEQYEQENIVPYITSIERIATKKGFEKGALIGEIRMLQRILSVAVESEETLLNVPNEDLARKRDELQQRFDLWQSEQRRD
jgi:hypothetical protein